MVDLLSFRKEPRRIAKGLELERVSGRVVEKHRRLLADEAGEANPRLDLEAHPGRSQPGRETLPVLPPEHDAEMRNRHVLAVDGVVMLAPRLRAWIKMRHELVTEEVEIDPFVSATSLRTAEQAAVESTCLTKIVDRNGEVKRRQTLGHTRNIHGACRSQANSRTTTDVGICNARTSLGGHAPGRPQIHRQDRRRKTA